jgi:hypothetical protein
LEVEKYNLVIIALSETKKKRVRQGSTWELFTSLERGKKGSIARAGVSILIYRKWKSKIRNWRFMGERILLVEVVT